MDVILKDYDIDRHGESCNCGLCNLVGKSYGVAIISKGERVPLDVIYAPSVKVAYHNAKKVCEHKQWQIKT